MAWICRSYRECLAVELGFREISDHFWVYSSSKLHSSEGEWSRRLTQISQICYKEQGTVDPVASFELHGCAGSRYQYMCHEVQRHIYWWTGLFSIISGNPDWSSLDFPFKSAWQKTRETPAIWPLQLSMCLKKVHIDIYIHTTCIFLNLDRIKHGSLRMILPTGIFKVKWENHRRCYLLYVWTTNTVQWY